MIFKFFSGATPLGSEHHELPLGFFLIVSRFKNNQKRAIFALTYNDYTITVNRRKTSEIASPAF